MLNYDSELMSVKIIKIWSIFLGSIPTQPKESAVEYHGYDNPELIIENTNEKIQQEICVCLPKKIFCAIQSIFRKCKTSSSAKSRIIKLTSW